MCHEYCHCIKIMSSDRQGEAVPGQAGQQQQLANPVQSLVLVGCRGFLVGAGLHVGERLVSDIASGRLVKSPSRCLWSLLSRDLLRFANFVSLAGVSYKLVTTLLRRRFKQLHGWHAVLAGLAAGLVSVIDDPQRRHTLSLFVTARALGAFVATLHRRGKLPTIPHFVTLVFGVCESLIILAVTHFPQVLPQGYYRSIVKWSMYYTDEKLATYFRRPYSEFIPCNALLHKGTCTAFAMKDFLNCFILYCKIYIALYSIPLVLFRTKVLFEQPKHSLLTLLQNTCVSALFLAMDGLIVKYGLCVLRNAWGGTPPVPIFIPLLVGFCGALGLLVERQSRRLELLYYVIPQVLYAMWRVLCIKKPLGLHKIPHGSVLLFCASLMIIMHAYEREKESISPLMNRSLCFLLGDSS